MAAHWTSGWAVLKVSLLAVRWADLMGASLIEHLAEQLVVHWADMMAWQMVLQMAALLAAA